MILCVAGMYLLSQFLETRNEIEDKRGIKSISTRQFNLDEEHKKMMKELGDIDNFTLSRIPRPDGEPEAKLPKRK